MTFANNVCDAAGNDVGGGAIYALGGIVNISNSVFTGNRGGNGGAIGQIQARFTIADTVFSGNATNPRVADGGNGGAIYIDGSNLGVLTLQRTVFTGNTATNLGGAIHTYMYGGASAMTIEDTTFADNVGTTNGGAIFHMNGGLTITGSTFSGNRVVGQGGALWVTDGGGGTAVAVTNSTFTGNQATGTRPNNGSVGLGGAIANSGASSLTLTNVTIAGNHADWVGGGIVSGPAGTTLKNSIVANNTAANGGNSWNIQKNCSNALGNGGGNLQWPTLNPNDGNDHACAAGITFADPRLAPLAANGGLTQTMALLSGSPALNSGVACPPPATDQRGVTRPQGVACDSGAFESRPEADLSVTGTDQRRVARSRPDDHVHPRGQERGADRRHRRARRRHVRGGPHRRQLDLHGHGRLLLHGERRGQHQRGGEPSRGRHGHLHRAGHDRSFRHPSRDEHGHDHGAGQPWRTRARPTTRPPS